MAETQTDGPTGVGMSIHDFHAKRVRWVLQQVWTEFYTNKPKMNLDLTREKSLNIAETSTQGALRWASHDQSRKTYADHINVVPKLLPSLGPDKLGASVAVEHRGRKSRLVSDAKPPNSGSAGPIKTCPKYSFCMKTTKSIKVWHDFTMTFVPMMEDAEVTKYSETFKSALWDRKGLDPDFDIIAYEVVARLKAEGMSDSEIDNTHLLPAHCNEILFYDLTRELPAFPTIGPNGEKEWKRRPPRPPLERHGREGNDIAEMDCPRIGCGHGCDRHLGDCTNDRMVLRRPTMATTHTDLAIPKQPCSDTCVFHLDKHDLEVSDSQARAATTFSRDQLSQLLSLLPGLEKLGMKYCDAAAMFAGTTCQGVAQEMKVWRTKILLQEDTKPIMDDQGEVVRMSGVMRDDVDEDSELPIDLMVPNMAYCTHLGPCGLSCPCAQQEATCERTCHCDNDCPRRWRGCRCRTDPKNPSKRCLPGKCPCRVNKRECDPGLCLCEPQRPIQGDGHKYRENPVCPNMGSRELQRPKTVVRVSKIPNAGYGLFAAEAINKGRPIDEYVGEVLPGRELDRRSIIYSVVGRNYVYDLGHSVFLDAFNYGNHTRFFNGTSSAKANVYSDTLNVCGEPRIIIRTLRAIKKGEEMLLDYGETFVGGGRRVKKTNKAPPSTSEDRSSFPVPDTPTRTPKAKRAKVGGEPRSAVPSPAAKRPRLSHKRKSSSMTNND